ncbi:hypothetical protein QBC35DRAFT_278198 [Podospora australis]|uniref:Uncharacterized protein n=1 Tax=Podospora australis TaxID=1536484 RepID=A0AAN6X5L5_9PEZI|nr:hypothetical protein QBC35DRAFT_278198 [Podospora australis]
MIPFFSNGFGEVLWRDWLWLELLSSDHVQSSVSFFGLFFFFFFFFFFRLSLGLLAGAGRWFGSLIAPGLAFLRSFSSAPALLNTSLLGAFAHYIVLDHGV